MIVVGETGPHLIRQPLDLDKKNKPAKQKLSTMKQFYVFGESFFAHPNPEILI